jgi:hypothetical protein
MQSMQMAAAAPHLWHVVLHCLDHDAVLLLRVGNLHTWQQQQ